MISCAREVRKQHGNVPSYAWNERNFECTLSINKSTVSNVTMNLIESVILAQNER